MSSIAATESFPTQPLEGAMTSFETGDSIDLDLPRSTNTITTDSDSSTVTDMDTGTDFGTVVTKVLQNSDVATKVLQDSAVVTRILQNSDVVTKVLQDSAVVTKVLSTSVLLSTPETGIIVEGRDEEFDVELSCSSSVHSISSEALNDTNNLGYTANTDDSSSSVSDPTALEHCDLNENQGTIYGKVVKSIQRSIRRIFHCGRAKNELLQPSQNSDCFAEARENPTTALSSESPPEVPMSAIQTMSTNSPITSVAPGDNYQTAPIHKTLLIDVSYTKPLLLPPMEHDLGKKCLVLDLDETLVHSTFQPVLNADLVVPVHLGEGVFQPIYVCKRPGVDQFLLHVSQHFEVVLFTASLSNYADPVIDFLDPNGGIRYRLYREDCLQFQGMYIKDLSRLGRDIDQVLIIDNSPASYSMHPFNALGCRSWFKDPHDRELEDRILPMLMNLKGSRSVSEWRSQNLKSIETPYSI